MKKKTEKMNNSDTNQAEQLRENAVSNRFKNISDITSDEIFIKNVESEISKLRYHRNKRPKPKAGFRYKRDWYDQMTDSGNFNSKYFLENIEKIWLKTSSITSNTRNVIQEICGVAYQNTIINYAKVDVKDTVSET